MEAIGKKIEQLGADADEVLAFVEECAKGPTLEEKAAAAKREEEECLAFIEQMEKRLVEIKSGDLALYNRNKAELEADIRKANTLYSSNAQVQHFITMLKEEMLKADQAIVKQRKRKKTQFIYVGGFLLLFCVGVYSLYSYNKKKAETEAFEKSPQHLIDVQCDSLCSLIDALEEPNNDNYYIQKDKLLKIRWITINTDKTVWQYEENKKDKFHNYVRDYTRKLVRVYQTSHNITNPHKAYDKEFNDLREYDGLYSFYEYGFQY